MDEKSKVVTRSQEFTCANLLGNPNAIAGWGVVGNADKAAVYSVHDSVQGCVGDCYFMAALASVAWAASNRLTAYPNYQFRNPNTGADAAVVLETRNLPKDAAGNLIFARLGQGLYRWPALYEKAYAKWKCGSIDGTADHANIPGLNEGCGLNGLISITRWAIANKVEKSAAEWDNNKPPNVAGKASVPAIAWTEGRADLPAGIYPNHSYSLLGFTATHVILRNPYGNLKSEPDANITSRVGVWNTINLTNVNDGIFALTIQAFKNYFYMYGWIHD